MPKRVAIVTGAFGALGSGLAAAAKLAGYLVAGVDYAPQSDTASPLDLILAGVDLAREDQAAEAINTVATKLGRLDVLFNVAGGFSWRMVADSEPDLWTGLHRLNLITALNTSRAALPHLLATGAGRIINVGAGAALKADAGMGAYAASKAAVHRLTEALAAETKGKGVTVNAVLPSIIDTPTNRKDMPDADFSQWVAPAELAAVMLFLASPEASAVTGALVPVTGRV